MVEGETGLFNRYVHAGVYERDGQGQGQDQAGLKGVQAKFKHAGVKFEPRPRATPSYDNKFSRSDEPLNKRTRT